MGHADCSDSTGFGGCAEGIWEDVGVAEGLRRETGGWSPEGRVSVTAGFCREVHFWRQKGRLEAVVRRLEEGRRGKRWRKWGGASGNGVGWCEWAEGTKALRGAEAESGRRKVEGFWRFGFLDFGAHRGPLFSCSKLSFLGRRPARFSRKNKAEVVVVAPVVAGVLDFLKKVQKSKRVRGCVRGRAPLAGRG